MDWWTVDSRDSLAALIDAAGILPFFRNRIPGWSLEEHITPSRWFTAEEGPWEWKAALAASKQSVYGRFVWGKNAWVSLDFFPDLANLRRDGYDFEGRCEDGLVPYREKQLMAWAEARAPVVSKAVRRGCGVTRGFDTALTHLEMQTFLINQDFVYDIDRSGKPYGWGNALLTTPEKWFGPPFLARAESRRPAESLDLLLEKLRERVPWADPALLRRALQG